MISHHESHNDSHTALVAENGKSGGWLPVQEIKGSNPDRVKLMNDINVFMLLSTVALE